MLWIEVRTKATYIFTKHFFLIPIQIHGVLLILKWLATSAFSHSGLSGYGVLMDLCFSWKV